MNNYISANVQFMPEIYMELFSVRGLEKGSAKIATDRSGPARVPRVRFAARGGGHGGAPRGQGARQAHARGCQAHAQA